MDSAGDKLRRIRERLKLTYRDVAQASREIAARRGSPEFAISLSRLAHIENAGRLPSVFRLYTLCAIYGLDLHEVLRWYGVPIESLATDSLRVELPETHCIQITPNRPPSARQPVEAEVDLKKTSFLNQLSRQWGRVPLSFIERDHHQYRYGLIGSEDWSLFPVIRPGSLVIIDECRRRVARGGWSNEYERPIYFLEHRGGFVCGWCALEGDRLVVQPHPSSDKLPQIFRYPEDVDVLGQICGVAMFLGSQEAAPGSARNSPSNVSRSVK
jgi:transcriptional regulator with XRE-family HTH domain